MKKKKQTFKNIVRQIHLWLGLSSGLVVVIVALTGAMYVFEEEGRQLFQHKYYHIPESNINIPRLPVDKMQETVTARYPKEKITSIRFQETKDAAFIFFMEKRYVSVDPTTAQIIGVRNKNADFFTVILKIHMELYMGEVGKEIIRWNVLIFFLMCVSGLILWFPKQLKFFKQATRINFKTKNYKRLNWDLHSVLGFYALLFLTVISLTGMFWVFDTAKEVAAGIFGGTTEYNAKRKPIKPESMGHFTLQDAYNAATQDFPGAKETFITPYNDKDANIRITMRYPYSIIRKQNTLYYSANTGKLVFSELYKNYTGYAAVARTNFDFHTGRIRALGIGSKIVYFLVALIAASLPITGFLVWWGRKKKKKLPAPAKHRIVKTVKVSPMIEKEEAVKNFSAN
ncbi:PepSY domain-containing protein [Chitinophaga sp. SYP-B3965]|uniref:PepSY-associated TM helix domain-containing protein n=1 Tax=Chitinophaga sp. SYP-B3965 TaxID=2663120 RepID=UPI0012998EAD|nr:PepSY-associated TM helix domain-containing protein [Chitinophaga sp. SYP-B3965]MRG47537.1 PepSY domain-containing protein [Chitinophaga sp. SYP-B3965]